MALKREIDWLRSLKLQEKEVQDAQTRSDATGILELQESYESLTKSNAKLEEQVTAMGRSLQAMQEELRLLKLEKEKKDLEKEREEKSAVTAVAPGDGGERGGCGRMVRRSGFRICKPQGTFLWPNMTGGSGICPSAGNGSSIMSSPSVAVAAEEPSGVPPTPHSASSATSPPRPILLPSSSWPRGLTRPTRSSPSRGPTAPTTSAPHPSPLTRRCAPLPPSLSLFSLSLSLARSLSHTHTLCFPEKEGSSGPARGGAKAAAWESGERSGGWSCTISTDLALSSPCYHR
ncbi:unnamed protein product [Spirodela intermedia]|uniref:Uncharacterized protein n=1 Tax=Spirodela intermedia TaxID=51605 RepID=A0A7I8KYW5_SPIIN|nr:unnamed protein product [Spirodela intermedia]